MLKVLQVAIKIIVMALFMFVAGISLTILGVNPYFTGVVMAFAGEAGLEMYRAGIGARLEESHGFYNTFSGRKNK